MGGASVASPDFFSCPERHISVRLESSDLVSCSRIWATAVAYEVSSTESTFSPLCSLFEDRLGSFSVGISIGCSVSKGSTLGPSGLKKSANNLRISCHIVRQIIQITEKGVYGDLLTRSDKPTHAPSTMTKMAPNRPKSTLRNHAIEAPKIPPPEPIFPMEKLFSHGIFISCQNAAPHKRSIHNPHTGLGSGASVFTIFTSDVRTIRKQRYMAKSPATWAVVLATHIVNVSTKP